jgi:integrase
MKKIKVPGLLHHKARDLGYSIDPRNRKTTYHGPFGLAQTTANYKKWLSEYLAQADTQIPTTPTDKKDPTIADLVVHFSKWADMYFRNPATGKPTSQIHVLKSAIRELKDYLQTPIAEFTPRDLIAVRAGLVHRDIMPQSIFTKRKKLTISSVNGLIIKIRMMFKRGVEWGLVPINVFSALMCVKPLSWRTAPTLRDPAPIQPVDEAHLDRIQPHLAPVYRVLMSVHLATGMRIKELIGMRWSEISQHPVKPWLYVYQPTTHKNSHRKQDRKIFIHESFVNLMKMTRKPLWEKDFVWCSKGKGINAGYSGQMTTAAYYLAVKSAIKKHNKISKVKVPNFTPLQIRHTVATKINESHGIQAVAAVLGHAKINTAQIYAETSFTAAMEIAEVTQVNSR